MQTQGKVRVGVVGVGSLGEHHARILSALPGAELVGVFDTNRGRCEGVARRYAARGFASMAELASSVDAATVAVPTDKHLEIFLALAAKGLHMLVEKPIASTTADAATMLKTAQDKGLILQVGHVERFNPVMGFLETNLARPTFIEATRLAPFPPPREGAAPRGTEVSVVLDLMIHDLEIILHIVRSPVREIHAVGVAVLSASEDIANARLVFESGCVANVTASRISRERLRKIRVFQEDTYISLDYMNQAGLLCRKGANAIETIPIPVEKGEPLAQELGSFVECVRQKRDPVVTAKHGTEALSLAVEICRRIKECPS